MMAVSLLGIVPACGSSDPTVGSTATSVPGSPATLDDSRSETSLAVPASVPPDERAGSEPADVDGRRSGSLRVGAEVMADGGFDRLAGRRVGVVLNQASTVDGRNLLDVLVEAPGVEVVAAFAPEHGIRSDGPAGAVVADGVDERTGVTVHSLYGETREPTPEMLAGVDLLVFDLQDVGARFYTYSSTLGGVMQAAARAGIPLLVLDRPNPLGGEVRDGFVLDPSFESFVGRYPIAAVHGLTMGELALAIRGQGWLPDLDGLDLDVVAMDGWRRADRWAETGRPWVAPSPGLPTVAAVDAYPATVLFEATTLSVGRGTDQPFDRIGAPWLDADALVADLRSRPLGGVDVRTTSFTPEATAAVPEPEYEGETVPGVEVEVTDPARYHPMEVGVHLLEAIRNQALADGVGEIIDRPATLDLLAGTDRLRTALEAGLPAAEITAGWHDDLVAQDQLLQRYQLYGP